ncbi:MBL fold metallo-hydrolase [Paenibacillus thalictri]|uniref:MBL fold metallo-hydrolase n=1 Tax=Paenibacillus thalictri TaxID=2527873 RepID=A0A4Q9DHB4_9BACL|nr:MBL fold metallo-hydrolase [Paenibacillus thalictri]TBL71239.1 MBL fold metallo-hydrolase [Paenibacillus thalictri]
MKSKYYNQIPTPMSTSFASLASMIKEYSRTGVQRKPDQAIPVRVMDAAALTEGEATQVTWFGHSASLIQIDGKRLLLDPMLGETSSPFPIFNSKRYSGRLPIEPEQLPPIDAILLSHNHYDHLHHGSIMKLKDKVEHFFVPLGVADYLIRWGVEPHKISEHNWWDEVEYMGLKLACTPARHFSGRGLFDRDQSLWCSWVIEGAEHKIFFSGDSGYAPHFKEVGAKYGPFDLTLMECGQYDERWSSIHMSPEETVQAQLDVQGGLMIPIHWGAFTLALHAWTDPVERALKAASQQNVRVITPQIGETVTLGMEDYPTAAWWR